MEQVLEQINAIRADFGLMPAEKISKGRRCCPTKCPIANTLLKDSEFDSCEVTDKLVIEFDGEFHEYKLRPQMVRFIWHFDYGYITALQNNK